MNLENDLSAIKQSTREFLDREHRLIIGGEYIASDSDDTLSVIDPSSGNIISKVSSGNSVDVDRAVASAKAALSDASWANMRAHERELMMHRLADLIEKHCDEIAELEALESGRRLADVRVFDAEFPAHIFRYMAGWPTKISGETLPVSAPYMPPGYSYQCYTTREPVGVVAAITPWNVPLGIAAWKVAPALAAGCTVILKPAEQTPLTALFFGELAIKAGFPPGVINIVTGTGQNVGEALVNHPDVSKVSFTGSTQTGQRIGEQAGRALKSVTLELGGKSPLVIMPDADMSVAIPTAAMAIFANQGQNCCAGSRLYVHKNVFNQVIDGVIEIAKSIRLGPSLSPDADMCPLISASQKARVQELVRSGLEQGAQIAVGGGSPDHPGFYHEPTVLTNVKQDMRVVQEEIFGPVLVAQPFDDLEEAIRLSNDSEFGLASSIFSKNIDTIQTFTRQIQAGSVWVNVHNILDVGVPFAGFKNSGVGNDLGKESVLAHTRLKANYITLN